jgi:hypothetical protein
MRLGVYDRYYQAVVERPGLRAVDYARACGVAHTSFMRVLPWMEYNGYLLAEDNNRLYPYAIVPRCPEQLHGEEVSRSTLWRRGKRGSREA